MPRGPRGYDSGRTYGRLQGTTEALAPLPATVQLRSIWPFTYRNGKGTLRGGGSIPGVAAIKKETPMSTVQLAGSRSADVDIPARPDAPFVHPAGDLDAELAQLFGPAASPLMASTSTCTSTCTCTASQYSSRPCCC